MDEIDPERSRGQARRMALALLVRPDDTACTACLDALEEYISEQLARADYTAHRPEVALHLDGCVDCAEAYAMLYEQRLYHHPVAPEGIPTPDFSFLQEGATAPISPAALRAARRRAPLREAIGKAVERAGAGVRLRISKALLDLLPPPAAPTLAFRSGADMGAPLFELALEEPVAEIARLEVSAYADAEKSERCAVRVLVAARGREWPDLAGVPVALVAGQDRRVTPTDAWGEAVFGDVSIASLPGLQLEVDAG